MRSTPGSFGLSLLALGVVFVASAALLPLLGTEDGANQGTSGSLTRYIWVVTYVVVIAVAIGRRMPVTQIVFRNRAVLALPAVALASIAWSDVRSQTLLSSTTFALTTLVAMYLGWRMTIGSFGDALAWALAGVALVSALLIFLDPPFGLDHIRNDAWRGAFTTKNELGRMMTLTLAVWFLRLVTLRGHPVVSLSITLLAGYLAIGSQSRTALIVLIVLALFFLTLPAVRAHYSIALPAAALFLAGAIVSVTWLVGHADATLATFGSDSSFTGRNKIWSVVWSMISDRPWLGYGYGAFWRGADGPSSQVWSVVGSTPPHAHNGVLDVWLDLGLLGVGCVLAAVTITAVRAARLARTSWSYESLLPLALVAFLVLYNVSESSFASRFSLFWILFVVSAVQLPSAARTPHPTRAAAPKRLASRPAVRLS